MSPSTLFGATAVGLTAIGAFLGVVAWFLSWREGRAKDAALMRFQQESTVAIEQAKARGEEANERAAELTKQAAGLAKDAEEAKKETAEARKETAALNERAAGLENETARARLELKKLQDKQQWRHIAPNGKFAASLAGKKKGRAEIVFLKDDSEAYTFAMDIWHELTAAGWSATQPTTGQGFGF